MENEYYCFKHSFGVCLAYYYFAYHPQMCSNVAYVLQAVASNACWPKVDASIAKVYLYGEYLITSSRFCDYLLN